jgi:hypothetical protein
MPVNSKSLLTYISHPPNACSVLRSSYSILVVLDLRIDELCRLLSYLCLRVSVNLSFRSAPCPMTSSVLCLPYRNRTSFKSIKKSSSKHILVYTVMFMSYATTFYNTDYNAFLSFRQEKTAFICWKYLVFKHVYSLQVALQKF